MRNSIVIGGSLAGLLATRVLSDHFSHVTVIERDRYPEGPENRAGLPQAHHVHALLLRGLHIIERLFPGIRQEFIERGGMLLDSAEDFSWFTPAGWAPRFQSGLPFLAISRPLIDWVIRRRVAGLPNVEFRQGLAVRGLSMDKQKSHMTGVTIQRADGSEPAYEMPANFVVDASGRASKSPQWLRMAGFPTPVEEIVNGHLGYSSRIFRRNPESQTQWKATFSQAGPPRVCRTGLAVPLENDRWMVTLAGGGGDYPPTDEQGFADFAKSLPNPGVYQIIRTSEPLTPIRGSRGTENRLRHWERLDLPQGFAVVGDAACAFNPVYGQGMTTAAIAAELLEESVRNGTMRAFQKRLTKAVQFPWTLATSEDIRYPNVEGAAAGFATQLMHRYLDSVIALSVRHSEVRLDLLGIFHLVRDPSALFRPGIVGRVLRDALFRRDAAAIASSAPVRA